MTNSFNHPGANLTSQTHCWAQENKPGPVLFPLCPAISYWHLKGKVITSLRKFCWRWSSDVPDGVTDSAAGRGCDKPKSEPGSWRNPREIRPATPHEPDQPQKLKQDAQTDSFGLQASRGSPVPTQPDRHSEFSRDVTQISYHLHRGESNKVVKYSVVFSITEGSCLRKTHLKTLSKRTSLISYHDRTLCYIPSANSLLQLPGMYSPGEKWRQLPKEVKLGAAFTSARSTEPALFQLLLYLHCQAGW